MAAAPRSRSTVAAATPDWSIATSSMNAAHDQRCVPLGASRALTGPVGERGDVVQHYRLQ